MSKLRPPAFAPGGAKRLARRCGKWTCACLVLAACNPACAEEGFWLYTAPPFASIAQTYGVRPDPSVLDNLMRSSARFDSGQNSGAFVSQDGLWLTNWHICRVFVEKMKDGERYMQDGYVAHARADEVRLLESEIKPRAPLRLRAVEAIDDVTARVASAATEAERAALIRDLERQASSKGRRGQVFKLFGGALYQLHRYRLFDDIRLVFTPERSVAIIEDPDTEATERMDYAGAFNFDVCFLRAYENGKPAKLRHWLRWSENGVEENELLYGSGDPGTSWRQEHAGRFQLERNVKQPMLYEMMRRLELQLQDLAEAKPAVREGLQDELKKVRERRLSLGWTVDELHGGARERNPGPRNHPVPGSTASANDATDRAAQAYAAMERLYPRYFLLHEWLGFNSRLLPTAQTLLEADRKRGTPEGDRLATSLAAETPFDRPVEMANIAAWLEMLAERMGPHDPLVRRILAGRTPREVARTVQSTQVADASWRLAYMQAKDAMASDDGLLAIALAMEDESRRTREEYEAQRAIAARAEDQLSMQRYQELGASTSYPDASNMLRLSYGTVTGAEVLGGRQRPWSTFGGIFEHVSRLNKPELLSARWTGAKARIDASLPYSFATTIDCVGGSSGSAIVNAKGEYVGVLSSTNVTLMSNSLTYAPRHDRCTIVDARAISAVLRNVYGAEALVSELGGR